MQRLQKQSIQPSKGMLGGENEMPLRRKGNEQPKSIEYGGLKGLRGSRWKDEILEYIYFDEEKTVYDARDYCQENNMKLAQEIFHAEKKHIQESPTDWNTLWKACKITDDYQLGVASKFVKKSIWLDLMEPQPICKNTKCWSWHASPYAIFNSGLAHITQ